MKKISKIGWTDKEQNIKDMIFVHKNTETIELAEIFDCKDDAKNNFDEIKKVRITIEELK